MIVIINSGYGNFKSVQNMISKIGFKAKLTNNYDEIINASKIILPGIGSFDKAIESLRKNKLDQAIYKALDKKTYLLGICVGIQMLFESSEEGNLKGLGLIKGKVIKFLNSDRNYPVPHMGWNTINIKKKSSILNLNEKFIRFYFAHSYYCVCKDEKNILATTNYSINFTSAVADNNIFGVQFHPEKSHDYGKKILKKFLMTDV